MTFETQAFGIASLLRRLALAFIRVYQRHLSPHKGFGCAYRVHTRHASCSVLGYRAVRRFGVRGGLVLLRRRLRLCGEVHRWHHPRLMLGRAAQRGFCDAGCDLPCDLPCDSGADFGSCCDCGSCDWPERKKKEERRSERKRTRS